MQLRPLTCTVLFHAHIIITGPTVPSQGDVELSIADLPTVLDKMWNARTKWYFIGVRFEIMAPDLDAIEAGSKNIGDMFRKMIATWLEKGRARTWRAIYNALEHPTVGQHSLANDIIHSKKVISSACAEPQGTVTSGPFSSLEVSGATAIHGDNAQQSPEDDPVYPRKVLRTEPQEISLTRGPLSPSAISGATAIHGDNAQQSPEDDPVYPRKVLRTEPQEISLKRGPLSPSKISGATAIHEDNAYFAAGHEIYVFHVPTKNWTETIQCKHDKYGLAAIRGELIVVGGTVTKVSIFSEITSKILCLSLSTSSEENTWEEKYPAMYTARINPQVVVFGNYLIALGGWTELEYGISRSKPTNSVEVLDLEQKCWYSNDRLSLPEVFTTIEWQSACICEKYIFIAAQHNDPNFDRAVRGIASHKSYECGYPTDIEFPQSDCYRCFLMYRCPVENLLHTALVNFNAKRVKSKNLWQELKNPHPAVYYNEKYNNVSRKPYVQEYVEEFYNYGEYCAVENKWLNYHDCTFTLACISSHTLIAVGCNHIKSITAEEVKSSLHDAYDFYADIKEYLSCVKEGSRNVYNFDSRLEIENERCHIYVYDIENDSWNYVTATPDSNGSPDYQPSVAIVNSRLCVVRNSRTLHISIC